MVILLLDLDMGCSPLESQYLGARCLWGSAGILKDGGGYYSQSSVLGVQGCKELS